MKYSLILFILIGYTSAFSQTKSFTRQDSLRGSITKERAWWDLKYYDLYVSVDPDKKFISGSNKVSFEAVADGEVVQIDLQPPMKITKVVQGKKELTIVKEGNAHFIQLAPQQQGATGEIEVFFEGRPLEAPRAPWDGGFSWKKDQNGKHFVATSNQGIGASIWWPCKDHMYDEPDNGMTLRINAPEGLTGVGNGRLDKIEKEKDGTRTFIWKVVNPINNYGVNVNIADYVNISSTYDGEKGKLDVDYWVLSYNKEIATEHFKDADRTLEALEYWFGPYPFYEDSYKLVEVPYLGMEHQSSVTYGNQYKKGYLGNDLSGTGWGLKWDYIIIHETGHEWFANNITYKDAADMWIHESFTMYSESLFIEYFYGKEAAATYTKGLRKGIQNREKIIGEYGVNKRGSGDMYTKGNNILHTIRQLVNDDEKWRAILRGLNEEFYHQTVTTAQIENYIANQAGLDLSSVFDQYLRDYRIPVLEYYMEENVMNYRWTNCIGSFDMPIKIFVDGKEQWLSPTSYTQRVKLEGESIEFDSNFYIYTTKIL